MQRLLRRVLLRMSAEKGENGAVYTGALVERLTRCGGSMDGLEACFLAIVQQLDTRSTSTEALHRGAPNLIRTLITTLHYA